MKKLKWEIQYWQHEAQYWKEKYENAERYIKDMQDEVYSYDDE